MRARGTSAKRSATSAARLLLISWPGPFLLAFSIGNTCELASQLAPSRRAPKRETQFLLSQSLYTVLYCTLPKKYDPL